tara:strand:+ start:4048 stop:4221 length:174 start_codon:yes stop_codon:yes gene_type:complete
MFNFSEKPFSTAIIDFFNGIVEDEINLHIQRSCVKTLDIINTHNIELELKRNNAIIL